VHPVASAAARSAIIAVAVWALFIAANLALHPTPWEYKPRDLPYIAMRTVLSPALLAATLAGWLMLWRWLVTTEGTTGERGNWPDRAMREVVVTLLLAAAILLLALAAMAVPHGWPFRIPTFDMSADNPIRFIWIFPERYLARLFMSAVFAVAVVRIMLPLIPRFDRMTPRNM